MTFNDCGIPEPTRYTANLTPWGDAQARLWVSCWPRYGARYDFSSSRWNLGCCGLIDDHELPMVEFHRLLKGFHQVRERLPKVAGVKIW